MKEKHNGKQTKQRLKPYLVLQYLLRYSDENNIAKTKDIIKFLSDELGIHAERRSIYKDIEEINQINLLLEYEHSADPITIDEAEEILANDDYDEEKLVVYDKSQKGFYVRQRRYEMDDIHLLAECVYSAKFLSEEKTEQLVDIVCDNVSTYQAQQIYSDAYLVDRTKTDNQAIVYNISTINQAMAKELDREIHIPEKISFKYMKYTFSDLKKKVERRKGERYIVSPYKLLINNGNYYLLAFDDKTQKPRVYRVDRMKNVCLIGTPRAGEEVMEKLDVSSFAYRTFSMYSGEKRSVCLQLIEPLLDVMIERFGTKLVTYTKVDEKHYSLSADIEVSEQFFSWLCGFGQRVKIISPQEVANKYVKHLKHIQKMYENC